MRNTCASVVLVLWLPLLTLFVAADDFTLSVDGSKAIGKVDERYLSWTIDAVALGHNFSNPVLAKIASHLSPAVFRMGGTAGDHLTYNLNSSIAEVSASVLTKDKWDSLHKFVEASGASFVFGINALTRTSDGSWDPSNARELLEYTAEQKYAMLGWELGNEPNIYPADSKVAPQQLAKDYVTFSSLVNEVYKKYGVETPKIIGPDVCCEFFNGKYLLDFLQAGGCDHLDALTWHFYPMDGHTANISNFLNTAQDVDRIRQGRYAPGAKALYEQGCKSAELWIGETSSAWGAGAPGLSDTFVDGFWWLDELAYSATQSNSVLLRQDLFGGHYGLIQETSWIPNPDYWTAVLWKQLIGTGVLNATITPYNHLVRAYAMCSKSNTVTLIVLNMDSKPATVQLSATLGNSYDEYLITAKNLTSQVALLNGKELQLDSNLDLPTIVGKKVQSQALNLPAYSYGFVSTSYKAEAC